MLGILGDHNCGGHLRRLVALLETGEWVELWRELKLSAETFESLQLPETTADDVLWHFCQQHQYVLLTGNRNKIGSASLEAVLAMPLPATALPVLTLADPERVIRETAYAEVVAVSLLERQLDMRHYLGVGRLYLP